MKTIDAYLELSWRPQSDRSLPSVSGMCRSSGVSKFITSEVVCQWQSHEIIFIGSPKCNG